VQNVLYSLLGLVFNGFLLQCVLLLSVPVWYHLFKLIGTQLLAMQFQSWPFHVWSYTVVTLINIAQRRHDYSHPTYAVYVDCALPFMIRSADHHFVYCWSYEGPLCWHHSPQAWTGCCKELLAQAWCHLVCTPNTDSDQTACQSSTLLGQRLSVHPPKVFPDLKDI